MGKPSMNLREDLGSIVPGPMSDPWAQAIGEIGDQVYSSAIRKQAQELEAKNREDLWNRQDTLKTEERDYEGVLTQEKYDREDLKDKEELKREELIDEKEWERGADRRKQQSDLTAAQIKREESTAAKNEAMMNAKGGLKLSDYVEMETEINTKYDEKVAEIRDAQSAGNDTGMYGLDSKGRERQLTYSDAVKKLEMSREAELKKLAGYMPKQKKKKRPMRGVDYDYVEEK